MFAQCSQLEKLCICDADQWTFSVVIMCVDDDVYWLLWNVLDIRCVDVFLRVDVPPAFCNSASPSLTSSRASRWIAYMISL